MNSQIVSDFGLNDAIESGFVKTPALLSAMTPSLERISNPGSTIASRRYSTMAFE